MDTVRALQQVGIVRRASERFGGGLQQEANGVLPLQTPAVRIDVSEQVGSARRPRPSVVEGHLCERSEDRGELPREFLGRARQVSVPCPGHRRALRTWGKASGHLFAQPEQGSNRGGGRQPPGVVSNDATLLGIGLEAQCELSSKTFIPSRSLRGS